SARQTAPTRVTSTRGLARSAAPGLDTGRGKRFLVGRAGRDRRGLVDRRVELVEQLAVRWQVLGAARVVDRLGQLAAGRHRPGRVVDHVGRADRLAPGELVDPLGEVVPDRDGVHLVGGAPGDLVVGAVA